MSGEAVFLSLIAGLLGSLLVIAVPQGFIVAANRKKLEQGLPVELPIYSRLRIATWLLLGGLMLALCVAVALGSPESAFAPFALPTGLLGWAAASVLAVRLGHAGKLRVDGERLHWQRGDEAQTIDLRREFALVEQRSVGKQHMPVVVLTLTQEDATLTFAYLRVGPDVAPGLPETQHRPEVYVFGGELAELHARLRKAKILATP